MNHFIGQSQIQMANKMNHALVRHNEASINKNLWLIAIVWN